MAGFKREGQNICIKFEAPHELHGLEIMSRRVRMRDLLQITHMAQLTGGGLAEQIEGAGKLCRVFSEVLLSWNLEDEDGAVPCSYDGMMEQDFGFVLQIVKAWIDAVSGVPIPLSQPSSGGSQSPVQLPPMEELSESL